MSSISESINYSISLSGVSSNAPSPDTRAASQNQRDTFNAIGSNISLSADSRSEWVVLRETLATGQQTLALAQLQEDAIDTLEGLFQDFQSHLSSSPAAPDDAFNAVSVTLAREIQEFVEQSAEIIPDFYFVEPDEVSLNHDNATVPRTIGSFFDVEDTTDRSGSQESIGVFEVSFEDVLNAYHRPDSCPLCQQMRNADTETQVHAAATSISGSPSVTGASSFGEGNGNGQRGVDALMMGSAWDLEPGETLTYSLYTGDGTDSHFQYDYNTYSGLTREAEDAFTLTSAQITASRLMAQGWDAVAGFSIEEITENYSTGEVGEIRIANAPVSYMGGGTGVGGVQAYARGPGTANFSGDIWIGDPAIRTYNALLNPGEIGYDTLAHEFGHSIGLKHPQDGTNNISGASDDTNRYSIMSYGQNEIYDRNLVMVDTGGVISTKRITPETPMVYDIDAAEYLYGSVNDTNSGDTTYSFSDGEIFIQSVVDADGIDTVDGSSQSTRSIIDLTPGSLSSIGLRSASEMADYYAANTSKSSAYFLSLWSANELSWDGNSIFGTANGTVDENGALYLGQENFGIASSAVIENAKGGAGDDEITGNNVDNQITGNGGDDALDGGDGTDTAIYSGDYADYTVTQTANGYTVTDNTADRDGTDTLTNIERLQFADQSVTIAASSGNSPQSGGQSPGNSSVVDVLVTGSSKPNSGGSYLRSAVSLGGFAAPHGMGAFGLLSMLDNPNGRSVSAVNDTLRTMKNTIHNAQLTQLQNNLSLLGDGSQLNTKQLSHQIQNHASVSAQSHIIDSVQAKRLLT